MTVSTDGESKLQLSQKFEQLRGRLESEVDRPGVVVLTSSTSEDGREVAAAGLAASFARTGYRVLLIDTASGFRPLTLTSPKVTLEEIAQGQTATPSPKFASLDLSNPALQGSSSQRSIIAFVDSMKSKFDYVVISADLNSNNSFGISCVAAADAVLVAVRVGRKLGRNDARISDDLDRLGDRFLGVVALDGRTIDELAGAASAERQRQGKPHGELERREVAGLVY